MPAFSLRNRIKILWVFFVSAQPLECLCMNELKFINIYFICGNLFLVLFFGSFKFFCCVYLCMELFRYMKNETVQLNETPTQWQFCIKQYIRRAKNKCQSNPVARTITFIHRNITDLVSRPFYYQPRGMKNFSYQWKKRRTAENYHCVSQ